MRSVSGSIWMAVAAFLILAVPRTPVAAEQDLPLRESYPGAEPFACPPWSAPTPAEPEAAREARALASQANEALVLGDLGRAESFLERALELDPGSAELLYRRARVLEAGGERAAAIAAFCEALAAGAGTEDGTDAQVRLDSLVALDRPTLQPNAVAAFERGVSFARAGRFTDAEAAFETAVREDPEWAPAVYNLGVTSAARGDLVKAAEHLRRYLVLAPSAPDVVQVSRALGRWEGSTERRALPDPNATLALGMFLPGTGQFYSGRTWTGLGVLAVATGAVATGLLVREVRVRCVGTAQPGESCPPQQVVGRQVHRPHMGLALAVAAGATVAGALEAFFRVRAIRADTPSLVASASNGDLILYSMRVP